MRFNLTTVVIISQFILKLIIYKDIIFIVNDNNKLEDIIPMMNDNNKSTDIISIIDDDN